MSNIRIKDLSTEATSLGTDDFIPVDGNTSGTRKISKENLGTTLEIPDVGTAPNETPLNQHLGSLAYQSSDGVSAAKIEVESTTGTATTQALTVTDGTDTNFVVQEDGKTGIGGVTPSTTLHIRSDSDKNLELGTLGNKASIAALNDARSAYVDMRIDADNLIIGNYSGGNVGIGTASPGNLLEVAGATPRVEINSTSGSPELLFSDGGASKFYVQYDTALDRLRFVKSGVGTRWAIDSSGNLVANGTAIDFGSAATSAGQGTGTTGSVSNSVLSDYEFGSWTPEFRMSSTNFAALTMDVLAAQYVKIGRHVHCQAYIRTDNVDTTGAGGYLIINGLPFVSEATASNYAGLTIHNSVNWTNAPTTGYVAHNSALIYLNRNGTTGTVALTASDVVNGAAANQNAIIFTVSYIAST